MKQSFKHMNFPWKALVLSGLISVSLASCDSWINDDEGDCDVSYRIGFRYTKNVLNADAFGSQVTDVHLSVYDKAGNMVLHKQQSRGLTTENDFFMDLDLKPGTYDMIAWCEGKSVIEDAVSFSLQGQSYGDPMSASGAVLPLESSDGISISDKDINRLYYGIRRNVEVPDTFGTVALDPIYLTKDTNHITVTLQNADGGEIDPENIEFSLEGQNSRLDWENALAGDTRFAYHPWSVKSIKASRAEAGDGVMAELTTGSILADVEQRLTVKRKDTGETIFRIPMVEYLLLVRSNYEQMTSDQDYLDRFDDFSMVFFMQEGYRWMSTHILINNWRVVPPQNEEL